MKFEVFFLIKICATLNQTRLTSGGAHLRGWGLGQYSLEGGEPLAPLYPIQPAREASPRPFSPIAMSLQQPQPANAATTANERTVFDSIAQLQF